ncbi:MAG TPA: carboxypeptidase-like regulatory domain-containing protein, partial [Thermoanaerobaculia bacterium]|nr:carboxypeptidase-like regulatory domain-containing protein [Thermoanaerobaculia bacterium]
MAKPPKPPGLLVRLRPAEQLVGRVVGDDGRPIRIAELRIAKLLDQGGTEWNSQTLRSPTGDFQIDLPEPGNYRLAVRSAGYREERLGDVAVAPGQAYSLGVIALHSGSKVLGSLVDRRDGRPLAGVEVAVLPQGTQMLEDLLNRVLAQTVSAEDGSFMLSGLTSGRYEMRARREGFAPGLARFTLDSDRTEDLGTVALDSGAMLRGRLVDRGGKPRPGLIVRVFDPEQSSLAPLAEQTTGEDGVFRGPALAAGRYRVQVLGSRLFLSEEIEVPSGGGEVVFDRTVGGVKLHGVITRRGDPVS